MSPWRILLAIGLAAQLAGCNIPDSTPLIFLQTTTVGISATTTAAQGTPELSLGYRDVDLAIVPVIAGGKKIAGKAPVNPDGSLNPPAPDNAALALTTADGKKSKSFSDALSVFGQFQVDTSAAVTSGPSAGLGKFFATGLAARSLATGYECKLAGTAKC
jgi:hypothetical protein